MKLDNTLELDRCPHCNVAAPNISLKYNLETNNSNNTIFRVWKIYVCSTCGGVVVGAYSKGKTSKIADELFPRPRNVDENIPNKPKEFLKQALETIHAPSGSIMLSASAIDAMLKDQGYKDGSLYTRIEKGVKDNLITEGMSKWAHQIRLEANDQRHADDDANLPLEDDARKIIDFASALAEFLYVLPAKVKHGIKVSKNTQ